MLAKRLQGVLCVSLGIAIQNHYKPTKQVFKWCDLFSANNRRLYEMQNIRTECGKLAVYTRTYIELPVEILPSIDLEFDTKLV